MSSDTPLVRVKGYTIAPELFAQGSSGEAASASGMHKWAMKPMYCILFPLDISNGVISYDGMIQGDQQWCSVSRQFDVPVFRACREELIYLLGEDSYRTLEEHCASLLRSPLPSLTLGEG